MPLRRHKYFQVRSRFLRRPRREAARMPSPNTRAAHSLSPSSSNLALHAAPRTRPAGWWYTRPAVRKNKRRRTTMQAEQETNNKAIAAQILCAFIAKSNVDSLLKEQKSSLVPENLESLWQRILKMVSSG